MSYFTEPRLSACIVVEDQGRRALRTVQCFQESDVELELHVVDNAPGGYLGESLAWQCPGAMYYPQRRNLGFAAACNIPLQYLRSEYHLLCTADMTFQPETLGFMVQYMDAHPECLILGPQVKGEDGQEIPLLRVEPTLRSLLGMAFPGVFKRWHAWAVLHSDDTKGPRYVDTVPGDFLLIRTRALQMMQGLDPRFIRRYGDCDLCRRALELGGVVYHPEMVATRLTPSEASGVKRKGGSLRDAIRYLNKWGWRG